MSENDVWIFDLDNTLYPSSARLFDQINVLMRQFITAALNVPDAEADRLRVLYWQRHGATLTGLIAEHGVDPDEFLSSCHNLDLSALEPDRRLAQAIEDLPGRRLIHTNGPRAHAERVLSARGLDAQFPEIIAIEDTSYVPKPKAEAFDAMLGHSGVDAQQAVMVEDQPDNLLEPHKRGMRTVWLAPAEADDHDHVHHRIEDLTGFLEQLPRS